MGPFLSSHKHCQKEPMTWVLQGHFDQNSAIFHGVHSFSLKINLVVWLKRGLFKFCEANTGSFCHFCFFFRWWWQITTRDWQFKDHSNVRILGNYSVSGPSGYPQDSTDAQPVGSSCPLTSVPSPSCGCSRPLFFGGAGGGGRRG